MKLKPAVCTSCGRLDPYQRKPCFCQQTTMQTKEKDVRLYYEHVTEGHAFMVKGCVGCEGDSVRRA